jgi:hypothetical protein
MLDELESFLGSTFSKNRRVPLSALVLRVPSGGTLPKGSLVVMASGDRQIRLKILEKETPHRGFSEPLLLNSFATQHKVTPHYLLWYLSQKVLSEYLLANATGSVFVRVPRKILYALPVALPTSVTKIKPINEFAIAREDTQFSRLIAGLYDDYLLNLKNRRYRTAALLAGAICEVILYQLLVEHGVSQRLLRDDRALGFGKLLNYVRVLKLEQQAGFPMSQLVEMQRIRNHSVHAALLINKSRDVEPRDLESFNPIIKYFGL